MGRLIITEYSNTGSEADDSAPILNINTLINTTDDSTTSTSSESVALSNNTKAINLTSKVGDHRFDVVDSTGTKYEFGQAGSSMQTGVKPGSTLYYRLDD